MTFVKVLAHHSLNLLTLFVTSNRHANLSDNVLLFIVEHDDWVLVLDDLLVEFFQRFNFKDMRLSIFPCKLLVHIVIRSCICLLISFRF